MEDFEREVIERSRTVPVLVDFWASWCGPCQVLGPRLERLAAEAGGRWELVKVETERWPELAARYGVRGIPDVKLFRDGEAVDGFVGALSEAEIRAWLAGALPSPHAALMARARELLDAGEADGARELLEGIARETPGDPAARVLLAEALLCEDPVAAEAALEGVGEDAEEADRARGLRVLARLLAGGDATAGEGVGAGHLRAAAGALRGRDYAAALESWIAALRADRAGAGGVAKEACKAMFWVLGLRHPITERYHRAFTSALYS